MSHPPPSANFVLMPFLHFMRLRAKFRVTRKESCGTETLQPSSLASTKSRFDQRGEAPNHWIRALRIFTVGFKVKGSPYKLVDTEIPIPSWPSARTLPASPGKGHKRAEQADRATSSKIASETSAMTGSELKKIKLYECPENRTRLGSRFGLRSFSATPACLHSPRLLELPKSTAHADSAFDCGSSNVRTLTTKSAFT